MNYLDQYTQWTNQLGAHKVTISGITVDVDRSIFSPNPELTYSSSMILDHFPEVRNKSVLDLGTGSGILSLYAAKQGAKKVIAVDLDERAVSNARRNVKNHSLDDRVQVIQSNLFDKVNEKYDLILANLPILGEDLSERLLGEAPTYLKEEGKLLLTSAEFGEVKALRDLSDKWEYQQHQINKFGVEWRLYTFTLKNNQWIYLAQDYQKKNSPIDEIGYNKILSLLGNAQGKRLLDYGCGSGNIAQRVAEKGALVTGVDISREAISTAKSKKISNASFSTTREYRVRPNFYEVIMLNFVVCCVEESEEVQRIFSNLYHQLQPKGELLILEPHPNSHLHEYLSMKREISGEVQEGSKIKVQLAGMDSSFYDYWRSRKFYLNSLNQVGFSEVEEFYPLASGPDWRDETKYPPFMILRAKK
ncbi:MAG: methyltransferase [Candidatus Woesearchaeota archaeon]|jgi:methylase of polypeptide subunit release factors